jgi:hypothetical protein
MVWVLFLSLHSLVSLPHKPERRTNPNLAVPESGQTFPTTPWYHRQVLRIPVKPMDNGCISFQRVQNLHYRAKLNWHAPMNPDHFIHFITETRRYLRNLGPIRGNSPITGQNVIWSKITRQSVYHMYLLLLDTYPDLSEEQMSAIRSEYRELIETIHHKFFTRQVGSPFAEPQ